jgi:hypothetical protein
MNSLCIVMTQIGIVGFAASCGLRYLGAYSQAPLNNACRVGLIMSSIMLGTVSLVI